MGRRYVAGIGVAASIVALSAFASSNVVAANGREAGGAAAISATHPVVGPPLTRPKPAASAPFMVPEASSPWRRLKNPPPFAPGTMLLQSDGTVLVHNEKFFVGGTNVWARLTPDATGSYVNGTWSRVPPMPASYNPLYFASAILPDGRMIVEGGEYLGATPAWTNKGAIYDPVRNSWRSVAPPPGWANIGDAQSVVLANGTYMLAQACQNCLSSNGVLSTNAALFNATGLNWNVIGSGGKNDPNDEEGWTLQPNGKVLTVDTWLSPTTELFTPSTLSWANAGNTFRSLVNAPSAEIGPAVLLPNGDTFAVSAGTGAIAPAPCTTRTPAATGLYHAGRWYNGPPIPTIGGRQFDSADGPASVLPNGNVLFPVSPCVFNTPLAFMLYNWQTRTLSPVPNVPNAASDSTYNTRMLNLPNGEVLFNDGSRLMMVYTASGRPDPSWAPIIQSVTDTTLARGQTASLSGLQLAGRDQGSAYGDDAQDDTNFPLVRITNSATGAVTYARTHDWSSVSVAPFAPSSTKFTVSPTTPRGASTLVVVANGIASRGVSVTIS
jgi:hypothetical protein